ESYRSLAEAYRSLSLSCVASRSPSRPSVTARLRGHERVLASGRGGRNHARGTRRTPIAPQPIIRMRMTDISRIRLVQESAAVASAASATAAFGLLTIGARLIAN